MVRAALAACAFVASAASAQRPLELESCARIEDAVVRLACFDALAEQRGAGTGGADEAGPAVYPIVVTALDTTPSGKAVFTTADGEVFDQVGLRTPRFPDVPFDARLTEASSGSFFLTLPDGSRRVRVSLR